jgi:hypothetical protein
MCIVVNCPKSLNCLILSSYEKVVAFWMIEGPLPKVWKPTHSNPINLVDLHFHNVFTTYYTISLGEVAHMCIIKHEITSPIRLHLLEPTYQAKKSFYIWTSWLESTFQCEAFQHLTFHKRKAIEFDCEGCK